ncbi:MAG: RES family NAD+ phosphorylase [Sediminicola sp.]
MILYRITKGPYKKDLSGSGAELYGGRWNNKGTKMLYTASSIALAMTEVAVHLPYGLLPTDYFVVSIKVPDVDMAVVSEKELEGTGWQSHPPSHITQAIGDRFVAQNKMLILKVPSVVVPGDFNYLLNPQHPFFSEVEIVEVRPFGFDGRLFGNRGE